MKTELQSFKRAMRGGKVNDETRDYILIKELYHCSPLELDNIPTKILDLHFSMLMSERKMEHIESKKAEQKSDIQKSLKTS